MVKQKFIVISEYGEIADLAAHLLRNEKQKVVLYIPHHASKRIGDGIVPKTDAKSAHQRRVPAHRNRHGRQDSNCSQRSYQVHQGKYLLYGMKYRTDIGQRVEKQISFYL